MRFAMWFLIGGSAALAACSSESSIRGQVREQIVTACTAQSGQNPIPGVEPEAFCNCLGDRAVANRSAEELRQLTGENGRAAGAEAGRQCVAELSRGAANTPTESNSEAANGASEETSEAEAAENAE